MHINKENIFWAAFYPGLRQAGHGSGLVAGNDGGWFLGLNLRHTSFLGQFRLFLSRFGFLGLFGLLDRSLHGA